MDIGLLTINTWKCDGDYFPRRQALATALHHLRSSPRVILCQECFQTVDQTVDTLDFLSAALKLPGYFVPGRRKHRSLNGEMIDSFSGLGILTDLPVSCQKIIDLPSNSLDTDRRAQLLTIDLLPDVSLLVANIHLTHLQHSEALRTEQLETVVQEIRRSDATYRIIGGDFNATLYSKELQLLKEREQAADCYQLGGGLEPRCTLLHSQQQGTHHCVDHLFVFDPIDKPYPLFAGAEVVLNRPDETTGLYPSDHFGIQTYLLIPD
jgi:endonuclease/exonuclease/phosphatase family metal-dependent hydrolase